MARKNESQPKAIDLPSYPDGNAGTPRDKLLEYRQTRDIALRNEIVEENLRLVVKIASEYARRLHLPIEDLFQEGSLGLIKAVEDFDPEKKFAFSTLATAYIRNSIFRYITNDARTIRIGTHDLTKYRKIASAEEELIHSLKRDVTDQEIFQKLGGTISEGEIARLRNGPSRILSLDTSTKDRDGQETGRSLGERFADDSADPRVLSLDNERDEMLLKALSCLDAEDRDIVLSRHQEKPVTLQELAKRYGISAEAVRQREGRALRKLKSLLTKD